MVSGRGDDSTGSMEAGSLGMEESWRAGVPSLDRAAVVWGDVVVRVDEVVGGRRD